MKSATCLAMPLLCLNYWPTLWSPMDQIRLVLSSVWRRILHLGLLFPFRKLWFNHFVLLVDDVIAITMMWLTHCVSGYLWRTFNNSIDIGSEDKMQFVDLMTRCWSHLAAQRPSFSDIIVVLGKLCETASEQEWQKKNIKPKKTAEILFFLPSQLPKST